MIDLSPFYFEIVKKILTKQIPEYDVWAFGSRVNGSSKPHSDLDLAIITQKPLESLKMAHLREAFELSDLPIKVDLVDWASISEEFREVIKERYEIVKKVQSEVLFLKTKSSSSNVP